ncbi:MAG: acyl-CoA dehydrogenase family protein [Candidatus Acidiferrum sp.]
MDFSFSDHQSLIRDTVRQFMNSEVRPHVKDWERTEHFPLAAIQKLGELGCCGMLVPESWGGPGLDTISYVLMLEEVARVHTAMSTAIAVTNSAVQIPLLAFGSDAQKKRYLPRLASGEILGAFCLTEPAAGSDAANIQSTAIPHTANVNPTTNAPATEAATTTELTTATAPATSSATAAKAANSTPASTAPPVAPAASRPSESASQKSSANISPTHYRLNGTKTWVTNGSHAGVFIIFAKTQPAAGGKGITAFLVEPTFPGFKVGRHEDKMGQRSSPSVEIILNDCLVPAENRLGEEGQGLKIALSALDNGRIGIAAQALGLAQGALDESTKYARSRKAFGKSIGEFQAIQWMLADMHTELEAARVLTYNAAFLKDAGASMGSAASRAKLYASEMVNRVVYKAVQIHGSQGYSRESDVERMYRDARVISIYEGTSEIQRTIIARDLLPR